MVEGSRRQFRLGRCLGRGGFGEVYLATMRSPGGLDTIVAVKILRDDLRMDPGAVRRLRDEGRMLSRVRHPSLVHVFDLTRLDGRVGLVTEYVEGDDLEGCLRPPDPISHRAVIQAIGIVAAGLAMAVTTRGADGEPLEIVHRDVKPSNIRIGRHGQVKLLDFGIARFTGTERESETVSDVVVGSVPYVAPERLCERSSLPAGDVFGLGCCLFEGIAGEPLHLDRSLRAVSALYLDADRYEAWLADRLDRLRLPDPTLRALVGGMLAHDPSRRPEAGEVARTCEVLGEVSSGPGLRRWGGDRRTWPAVGVPGPLEGLTLIEGELSIDEVETDEDGPKLIPIGPIDGPKRI
ncbi:MAG: serine/threonine-protein kinase, partial [Myxococcota bacterium]